VTCPTEFSKPGLDRVLLQPHQHPEAALLPGRRSAPLDAHNWAKPKTSGVSAQRPALIAAPGTLGSAHRTATLQQFLIQQECSQGTTAWKRKNKQL